MKKLTRILALLLMLSFLMVGCGAATTSEAPSEEKKTEEPAAQPAAEEPAAEKAPVEKTACAIGSSGATGAQYIISAAMANEINKYSDLISLDVQATSGGSENAMLCESGENAFGVVNVGSSWCYYHGDGYVDATEQTENLVAVMALQASAGQLIVSKKSGIESWEDLAGKRVCLGTPTASVNSMSKAILGAYGINWETDLASAEVMSQSEMTEKLSDGDLDAIFMMAAVPTAAIMNLFSNPGEYAIIDADTAVLQKVIDEVYPFLSLYTIPAGTYSGVDYDVHTLCDRSGIVCNKNVSDDIVYEFCKQVYENWDVIKEGHATLPTIDITTIDNVSIPLHPGAERYYAEIGILG